MIYQTKKERAEEARRIFSNAEFREEDHPRAEDGKFGKGGGSSKEDKNKKGKTPEKKQELKELVDLPTSPDAAKSPDGTKSEWNPEDGGLLFHGTNAPTNIEYLEKGSEGVVFLTDDFKEAEQYAEGAHLGGSDAKDTKRVLYIDTIGGKTLNVDAEINQMVEDGEDDFTPIFDKAREQGADYVYFSHPSNYSDERQQNVVVALNPGDTIGPAKTGWDLEKKLRFRGKITNSIKVYRIQGKKN